MFLRTAAIIIVILTVFFNLLMSSCATQPSPAETTANTVEESRKSEPVETEETLVQEAAPAEAGLDWIEPEIIDIGIKTEPVPEVSLRAVVKPEDEPLPAPEPIPSVYTVPEPVITPPEAPRSSPVSESAEPRKSFLELIFDPASTRAKEEPPAAKAEAPQSTSAENVPEAAAVSGTAETSPTAVSANTPQAEADAMPEPDRIDVSAPARELFIYECEGEGWRLEAVSDPDGQSTDRLRYAGREYFTGSTVFSFYPYSDGVFLINLVKTDFSTGKAERVGIRLIVTESASGYAGVSAEATAPASTGDTHGPDDAAIDLEDGSAEPELIFDAEVLIETSLRLSNAGDCRSAAKLLEDSVEQIEWGERDAVYFELAGIYEKCPELRDERRSVDLYREIVDYYPVSNYWTAAKERIIYLERNFIYIR